MQYNEGFFYNIWVCPIYNHLDAGRLQSLILVYATVRALNTEAIHDLKLHFWNFGKIKWEFVRASVNNLYVKTIPEDATGLHN